MPRMLDLDCAACGHQIRDQFFMEVPDVYPCPQCGAPMDRAWYLVRRERTQWHESEEVVVFRKPDGSFSFPARNDKPCPQGWERISARSDRELARIEKMTHSSSERRWFDKGSGRGFDDKFNGKDYS